MAEGCCANCAKILLIVFNIVFWLCGAAVLGVGIWMLVDDGISNYIKVFAAFDAQGPFIQYAAYALIGTGGFIFLIGFLGCCAAMNENKCLLGMYIFFLVVILIALAGVGVLGIIFQQQILKNFNEEFTKILTDNYGKENDDTATAFTEGMNYVMKTFECCGVTNSTDIKQTAYYARENQLPKECCAGVYNNNHCPEDYTAGCGTKFEDFVDEKSIYIIGVGIGIACVLIFGIVFSICLCRNADDGDDD